MLQNGKLELEESQKGMSCPSSHVLLVDDNVELLAVLRQILEANGYQVSLASMVNQAIGLLDVFIPDIIICDIMLPDRSGFDLYEEVRANSRWYEVPFLFLSALSGEEHIRLGKQLGCDDYLTKPFNPDDLVSVVKGKLALAECRKKMQVKRFEDYRKRIIQTLSHEFRTPLVSINTGAELLLEQNEGLGEVQVRRLLESILRGGQRLERLVDDFMLLQQIDLGHAEHTCELYRQTLPLVQIVDTAIECYEEIHGERPHPLTKDYLNERENSKIKICVYDVQVINVIQRLLNNAYKFAGRENAVMVRVGKHDDKAFVSIRDYGPGLKKDSAPAEDACLPFMQIDREFLEQQGCGLGLTISKYFTEINGGTLTLDTPEDGIGLEAVVSFPLV